MLHGRESLIRLIGKRRRAYSSLLARSLRSKDGSDYGDAMCVNSEDDPVTNDGVEVGNTRKRGSEACVEWVCCPVCAVSQCFSDACLANGKKKKLSQRTLLQVNFLSKSRQETCLIEANSPNMDKCEKELSEEKQLEFGSQTSILEVLDEDAVKRKAADPHIPSTFPSIIRSPRSDSCEDVDTKYVHTLETLIVGRRFHKKIELQPGGRVYVVRECQNVKDDNAIQVLSDHQGFRCSLGYLPRKLAKYLSPLIDYHHLKCEGSILSLPEHPLHDVPIKLFCKKVVRDGDIISGYQKDFELLWEKVLFANESAKSQPISIEKYQQNFRLMLEDVLDNHSHLFTNEEKCFIGSFSSLSDDAQRLLVRLYTRKGPWFRLSNISYKEISDLNAAIHELQMTSYLFSLGSGVQSFKYNMKEVLDVLTVSELQQISHQWLSKKGMHHRRKKEIIEFILSASKNGSCSAVLQKMVLEHAGKCVMISSAVDAILWRVQRLFFLNSEQDLSAFLLVDMGLIKFPEFTCTITQPIFKCRADLLEYEEAIEVAQIMDESIDQSDMEMSRRCIELSDNQMLANFSEEIMSPVSGTQLRFFHYFSAWWVYSKLLTLGVSLYEREHRYDDATRLLRQLLKRTICDSRRGYWTLRLSVDLEHLGYFNESLCVAEKGVGDPCIRAGSKMALQRRVLRLGRPPRRWKMPSYADTAMQKIKEVKIVGRPLNNETGLKSLFYGCDDELCEVEQLALQYYAEEGGGWLGIHSESGIWMTIFGLLMWDVIFSDVPNVFQSMFQVAPLDLLTDDFYVMRKSSIESLLQKIYEGMAEEMLITSWQLNKGTACHGVNWDRFPLSDLRAAVSCVGGRCLASLCRHLAMDYKSWSSGMPDLLLWRFRGGDMDGGEAKLVEVKGPRDRLSEQQRAWILTLMECGFDAEVCKVSPPPKS
ncbi:fanconi-associated nuclease 1 homolog isoform X3 [Dendrobium catenatum]|uniref:fanconi-associated nuclease 1 homolog isoform X3 n=1 Tax=Dendrobium catenatum TaxID=906689 RepID=UPI0009F5B931|nr:fanconi-associated nuclease 1 homolog isoform X3 [Dendrobium catenatum]